MADEATTAEHKAYNMSSSDRMKTYAVPGHNTPQVSTYSIQAILLNLLVVCDNKVCGISLRYKTMFEAAMLVQPKGTIPSRLNMSAGTPSDPVPSCGHQQGVF